MSLLALFTVSAASLKLEVELAIKYTSACPAHSESHIVVDRGAQIVKPPLRGPSYIWIEPGPHHIYVTHSWCTFYDVDLLLEDDGRFTAVTNSTSIERYPITIRHLPNVDEDLWSSLLNPRGMVSLLVIPVGFYLLRRCMSSGKMQQMMKDAMEQAQQQQQEAARQRGNQ
jgi:hypothetical protein